MFKIINSARKRKTSFELSWYELLKKCKGGFLGIPKGYLREN